MRPSLKRACKAWLSIALFLAGAPCASAGAGGVAVVGTLLTDNGDGDPYADTQETVTLRLIVRNTTGALLEGVVARVTTADGALACLSQPAIVIGDLAPGEERTTDAGFVFVVSPGVQRGATGDDLSVHFALSIRDAGGVERATTRWIDLDLDLDVSGGSGPTTFFEGFEAGFGSFTTMHLDAELNPPDSDMNNSYAGQLLADGHRCQYSDPDWEPNDCGMTACPTDCHPNANGAPDEFYFHIVTDSAYSGAQSMGFNVLLDAGRGYTTPTAQLEAIRTLDPVNLAWEPTCSVSGTPCADDLDCPTGETCDDTSFKHQISHADHRTLIPAQPGRTADRSVVAVQLAAGDGTPVGPWAKAYPFVNVYDTQANSNFFNCSFDPIDDGNIEEDFFDPSDPARTLGPSSTCAPEFAFAHQGDTGGPFDPDEVGDADPGGGLEGTLGPGTWVEPAFDLGRFRGRRLRVRFLSTGLKLGTARLWDGLVVNPDPGDDGWFIDDVTLTHALADAATATPDGKDNSGLPFDPGGDQESDGVYDVCDNCPTLGNAGQADRDLDGIGDACDPCPSDPLNDVDADGRCAGDDNCPVNGNALQADADQDGVGDACDTCPLDPNPTQATDDDGDGVDCPADNCPGVANAGQADADADGIGDACDACPADPAGDADGDGVCGAQDTCPFAYNPTQGRAVVLSAPALSDFRLTPNEGRLVGRTSGGVLHGVPTDGGPAVALSPFAVLDYAVTADSATVVYRRASGDRGLYSASMLGGPPTRLGLDFSDREVFEFVLGPDGLRVAFGMSTGPSRVIFSASVHGGPSASLSGFLGADTTTRLIGFSPDGSGVLFVGRDSGNREALYVSAAAGGLVSRLTPPLVAGGAIVEAAFLPDGSGVVYRADQEVDNRVELYIAPADGTALPLKISGPLAVAAGDVGGFAIGPGGAQVAYLADAEVDERDELYGVATTGGLVVRLNPALVGSVVSYAFTPDGSAVVFTAESQDVSSSELFFVPPSGGTPTTLADWGPGERIEPFSITPDGARVVYRRAAGNMGAMLSVELADGSTVPLSPDPVAGPGVAFRISAEGQYVLYSAGPPELLYSTPVAGGASVELSDGLDPIVPVTTALTHDGGVVYWRGVASGLLAGWLEPDADADGLHAACDCDGSYPGSSVEVNDGLDAQCPGQAGFGLVDELQGPIGFTDPADPLRFAWPPQIGAVEYEVIRSGDSRFLTDCACTRLRATGLVLSEVPAPGATYSYLPRALAPNRGSAGADSSGVERDGVCLTQACR